MTIQPNLDSNWPFSEYPYPQTDSKKHDRLKTHSYTTDMPYPDTSQQPENPISSNYKKC